MTTPQMKIARHIRENLTAVPGARRVWWAMADVKDAWSNRLFDAIAGDEIISTTRPDDHVYTVVVTLLDRWIWSSNDDHLPTSILSIPQLREWFNDADVATTLVNEYLTDQIKLGNCEGLGIWEVIQHAQLRWEVRLIRVLQATISEIAREQA